MYLNDSFTFDYDLTAKLVESDSGKELATFKAREFSEKVGLASVVSGVGVAFDGQSYAIATNENVSRLVKAFSSQVIIDYGEFTEEFKVLSVGIFRDGVVKGVRKNDKFETVIYLG